MMDWIKEHVLLTVLIGIGFIGASIGGIEFSSSTWFCSNACHIMDQEAKTFKKSHHWIIGEKIGGHGIGCKSCHYGPGIMGIVNAKVGAMLHEMPNTILGKEGIDWDKFEHEMVEEFAYGEDQSKWPKQYIHQTGKRKHGIKPHGAKFEDTNYNCRRCHTPISKYIEGNGLLREKEKKQDLLTDKVLVDEHLAEQLPPKEWDDPLIMKVERVRKDHPGHQDRGLYCTDCHMEVAHGYDPPYNKPTMDRCFRCHNDNQEEKVYKDKRAFRSTCQRCHVTQKNMHAGVGGIGVEDAPGYMNGQMQDDGCVMCHVEDNGYKMSRQACIDCHSDGYETNVDDWQNTITGLITNIKPLFKEVHNLIKQAEANQVSPGKAKKLYHEAKYNYDYVIADSSKGGHNVDYAESLLDIAKQKLEKAKEALRN